MVALKSRAGITRSPKQATKRTKLQSLRNIILKKDWRNCALFLHACKELDGHKMGKKNANNFQHVVQGIYIQSRLFRYYLNIIYERQYFVNSIYYIIISANSMRILIRSTQ